MTTNYKIPSDMRPKIERLAPTLTLAKWHALDRFDTDTSRALLAYADEVAAGLQAREVQALQCACVSLADVGACRFRIVRRLQALSLVNKEGLATDYGRYIAGRVVALRGER